MKPEEAIQLQTEVVTAKANLFVDACPGAGKTRTVVDRFLDRSARAAKAGAGVGVISFTNRAANEVSTRCAELGRSNASGFPHFVGTFDRFVATFVVRPFGQFGGPIRIIDSWRSLEVEIRGPGGKPVSLDHFEVSPDGVLRFDRRDTDPNLSSPHALIRERNAADEIKILREQGYLTCDNARDYAVRLLREHPEIGLTLRNRFFEVIVDEAQDCSETELDFLDELKLAGVPLVVVCDPNQAIYEWRDASPTRFAEFTESLRRHELTGNWRSSPAICQLAASLKDGSADHPVGDNRDDPSPIHLIPYEGWPSSGVADSFRQLLVEAEIETNKAIVLSHATAVASRVTGRSHKRPSNNMARIAIDTPLLLDPMTEAHELFRAQDRLQRLVLRYLQILTAGDSTPRLCELHAVDPDWLKLATLGLVQATAALAIDLPVEDWLEHTRSELGSIITPDGQRAGKPKVFLRAPKNSAGKTVENLLGSLPARALFRSSSIHQAKGSEAEAALVVLSRDRGQLTRTAELLDAWGLGRNTEARRVLYVGVTRAQRLCAIAVPAATASQVEQILESASVPFTTRH